MSVFDMILARVLLVHGLVDLEELATGQAQQATGLATVQQQVAVAALQRQRPALGDHERDHRTTNSETCRTRIIVLMLRSKL